MEKSDIPADVRRFVLARIGSVPHIEALLLLRASLPARWRAAALAQRLYIGTGLAADVLAALARAGLLQREESDLYYYGPESDALAEVVESLATLYGTHLVEITMLIHSKLDRKAQQFADAFDFRKES